MSKKFRNIPKILKINEIDKYALKIAVMFNNGENRVIDFGKLFNEWEVSDADPEIQLKNPDEFEKVILSNDTLTWENVELYISNKNGDKIGVPYDIGSDVLYKASVIDELRTFSLGKLLKKWRLEQKLTQEEVAIKSGTSRTYITKIENDKQDIEIKTFIRIIEAGLGKKLKLSIE